MSQLVARGFLVSILLLVATCANAASAQNTTLCALATHPKDFAHTLVRIRVRIDGNDEFQDLLDEKCPSQKLIWTSDAPSANKDALDHLALAIHQVFLHNRPASPHIPSSQYLAVTATVTGFIDAKPFVEVYGFSPVDASDVRVRPANPLEPVPPATVKRATP